MAQGEFTGLGSPGGGLGTDLAEKSAWDGHQWGPSCRQGISWKTEDEGEGWKQPAQSFLFLSTPAQVFPTPEGGLRAQKLCRGRGDPRPRGRKEPGEDIGSSSHLCLSSLQISSGLGELGGILSAQLPGTGIDVLGWVSSLLLLHQSFT